jgi:hypothetical protein
MALFQYGGIGNRRLNQIKTDGCEILSNDTISEIRDKKVNFSATDNKIFR